MVGRRRRCRWGMKEMMMLVVGTGGRCGCSGRKEMMMLVVGTEVMSGCSGRKETTM